ncbi:MAG: hypothetical protein EBX41_11380, partial [Chitinophagia bacterium]|nr:hypothetical protein [Chitinophagia bacterium]
MVTKNTPHNSILKSLARKAMTGLLRKLYRVEIKGIENLPSSPDEKLLVICNHQSFLDAAILSLFMPIPLTFAVNKFVAERKLIKFFLSFSKVVPVDTSTPLAMKELVDCVKAGENVMIFP